MDDEIFACVFHAGNGFMCDSNRPFVFVRTPGNTFRFEFLVVPGDDHEDLTMNPSTIRKLLHSINVDPDAFEILRSIIYTFHARRISDGTERSSLVAHCTC
jgi:hypothetical protein